MLLVQSGEGKAYFLVGAIGLGGWGLVDLAIGT